jgi:ketosteroid isomerase-like protein
MHTFVRALLAGALVPALSAGAASGKVTSDDCEELRVRRELEASYSRLADANRRKDLDALLAQRTRDFVAEMPGGLRNDFDAMANYTRAMFQQVERIANLSNTILKLSLNGDEATATVFQQFSRTQTKAGRLRNIDTSVIQDETWVRTTEGWKVRRVSNIHARKWYVDGKRVDPTRPYDPEAPPHNPPIDADE